MIRAADYSRYSDSKQSESSVEDQIRLCREYAEKEGWEITAEYSDRAISGASVLLRPGIQKLMQDATDGKFDVVIAEALDRLSRNQADIAAIYERLKFAGISLYTLSEGEIGTLHIGLKGTMNELFLKDLADKTRRGLRGRVEKGKSGGGNSYGYDVVRKFNDDGEALNGERKINEVQADIVCRIFNDYLAGKSPKTIAQELNEEGLPGPSGKAWGPSTIYGNWRRGTGILNNELYIGRMVWNRLRYIKDPDTGKRVSRPNPESKWVIHDVPQLQIIPQTIWDQVKARQKKSRKTQINLWDRRRPKYLLSNLMKCGCCGGGYSRVSGTRVGCSTSRNKGLSVCDNRRTIKQDVVENTVLAILKHELMKPELVDEFCTEYTRYINKLRSERSASARDFRSELEKLKSDEQKLIDALLNGFANEELKVRLNAIDVRKKELESYLVDKTETPTLIHPVMAERYYKEVTSLAETLSDAEHRHEASQHLRLLIDKIVLVPDPDSNGLLIDLHGDLPGILNIACSKDGLSGSETEEEIKMIRLVSGVGNDAENEGPNTSQSQGNHVVPGFIANRQAMMVAGVYPDHNLPDGQAMAVASPRNQNLYSLTYRYLFGLICSFGHELIYFPPRLIFSI